MRYSILGAVVSTTMLLVVASCSGNVAGKPLATAPVQTVHITLSDFKIVSSTTTFTAGVLYHFIVTNSGQASHELMIMPMMAQDTAGMPMEQLHSMALMMVDAFPPGTTQTMDYTFTMDPHHTNMMMDAQGRAQIELSCHLSGHYEAGMKLMATVHG